MFNQLENLNLDLIPKSTEFDYNEKMSELLRLIPEEDLGKTVEVAFSKLMTLHQAFLQNYKEFENI